MAAAIYVRLLHFVFDLSNILDNQQVVLTKLHQSKIIY